MLTLEEAHAKLLDLAQPMPTDTVAVEQAAGRYLSSDLVARRSQPPANLSAMDGFAMCGPGPWAIVGESRAGHSFEGILKPGQAIKISTGAKVPPAGDRI